MPAYLPVTVPARGETVFDQIRLSRLVIQQAGVGALTRIDYTLAYYSLTAGDAPRETERSGSVQLSLDAMIAFAGMPEAIGAITAAVVEKAIEAGVLPASQ